MKIYQGNTKSLLNFIYKIFGVHENSKFNRQNLKEREGYLRILFFESCMKTDTIDVFESVYWT